MVVQWGIPETDLCRLLLYVCFDGLSEPSVVHRGNLPLSILPPPFLLSARFVGLPPLLLFLIFSRAVLSLCLFDQSALDLTGYGGRVVLGSWYGGGAAQLNLGMAFHRSHLTIQTSQVRVKQH